MLIFAGIRGGGGALEKAPLTRAAFKITGGGRGRLRHQPAAMHKAEQQRADDKDAELWNGCPLWLVLKEQYIYETASPQYFAIPWN